MDSTETAAPPRILPPKVTADRAGFHLRTLQREVSEGRFPKPVQLTTQRIGFREDQVTAWINSRPVVG